MQKRITRRRFGSVLMATAAAPAVASRAMAADPLARRATLGDGDVGAVLSSGKPYFPMLLGNGMEHVLIGGNISPEVTNDSDHRQSIGVHACGGKAWKEAASLEPGKKMTLPSQKGLSKRNR